MVKIYKQCWLTIQCSISIEKTDLQLNLKFWGGRVVVDLWILVSAKVQILWDLRLETFGLTKFSCPTTTLHRIQPTSPPPLSPNLLSYGVGGWWCQPKSKSFETFSCGVGGCWVQNLPKSKSLALMTLTLDFGLHNCELPK